MPDKLDEVELVEREVTETILPPDYYNGKMHPGMVAEHRSFCARRPDSEEPCPLLQQSKNNNVCDACGLRWPFAGEVLNPLKISAMLRAKSILFYGNHQPAAQVLQECSATKIKYDLDALVQSQEHPGDHDCEFENCGAEAVRNNAQYGFMCQKCTKLLVSRITAWRRAGHAGWPPVQYALRPRNTNGVRMAGQKVVRKPLELNPVEGQCRLQGCERPAEIRTRMYGVVCHRCKSRITNRTMEWRRENGPGWPPESYVLRPFVPRKKGWRTKRRLQQEAQHDRNQKRKQEPKADAKQFRTTIKPPGMPVETPGPEHLAHRLRPLPGGAG